MRIAIVHFHLQTGGVTRVIQHACEALAATGHRVLVIAGDPPEQPLGGAIDVAVLPGLRYEESRVGLTPDALASAMVKAARERLGGLPDLWHIHNHCLGKNLALPAAVLRLARNGHRLLLQPHDFAEDGRPALYRRMRDQLADGDVGRLSAILYPLAPQIHYAALNGRDLGFLANAGIPETNRHLLANAVTPPTTEIAARCVDDAPERCSDDKRLWLYPTRAIRRKNLGEFLLWSVVGERQDRFATTQAPQNPQEQPRYRHWLGLAKELDLPLEFELGRRADNFHALLASSYALVTTSVGEGFGLAFLEPWLSGRPLVGRDLPEITCDFRASGVRLDDLYERLAVPLAWVDNGRLRASFSDALAANATAYGRSLPGNAFERAWLSAATDAHIDMGRLDEPAQESVIRRLHANPTAFAEMMPSQLIATDDAKIIAANDSAIRASYGLHGYGRGLASLYAGIMEAIPSASFGRGDGEKLLDQFLAPERLTLLRT
ncbi:MAG: glycosyltransferase family 4 protein [Thiohalocapsa sp.]